MNQILEEETEVFKSPEPALKRDSLLQKRDSELFNIKTPLLKRYTDTFQNEFSDDYGVIQGGSSPIETEMELNNSEKNLTKKDGNLNSIIDLMKCSGRLNLEDLSDPVGFFSFTY